MVYHPRCFGVVFYYPCSSDSIVPTQTILPGIECRGDLSKCALCHDEIPPAQEFYFECVDDPESWLYYQVSHVRETPCDGIEHPCPLERVLQECESVTVIHNHCQANGEWRIVEVIAAPLRDADGALRGIVESMRDIIERKREEQVLQQYTDCLRSLALQLVEVEGYERTQ